MYKNSYYELTDHIFQQGKGGIFRQRSMKDALDILTMMYGNPLIFTYSSGFGALALQLKQVRDNFCSNWSSLDWGKREWPPIGTVGEGGVRGVKKGSKVVSKICAMIPDKNEPFNNISYCSVLLKKTAKEKIIFMNNLYNRVGKRKTPPKDKNH